MEVHHHSNSPGHHSPGTKKKWTHYFWEFLMLFLAVFCGFLAENIREHKVEDIRAKEFANSLVHDLQSDTAAVGFFKKSARSYIAICDTLLHLNNSRLEGPTATRFYFYTRFTYWTTRVAWNRTTFEQIKNSGSLRYFKHRLLEKLMKYDAVINALERESSNRETRGNDLLFTINKFMDPQMHQDVSKEFIWTLDTLSQTAMNNYLSRETSSLENKRNEITEMLNMIVVQQRNLRYGEAKLSEAERLARELIGDFSKEYSLSEK